MMSFVFSQDIIEVLKQTTQKPTKWLLVLNINILKRINENMAYEIKEMIFRLTDSTSTNVFVGCHGIVDLYNYIAHAALDGQVFSSVVEIRKDGTMHSVDVYSNDEYKQAFDKINTPIVEVREEYEIIKRENDVDGIIYELIPITEDGEKLVRGFHFCEMYCFSLLFSPLEEARYKAEMWIQRMSSIARIVIVNKNE